MNLREGSQSFGLLENIPEGFVALDREFRIVYVNREARRLLQADREALLGEPCWELLAGTVATKIEHATKIDYATKIEHAKIEHELRRAATEFEYYYRRLSRWFWVKASRYADGFLLSIRDITGLKQEEEELRRGREQSDSRLAELEAIYAQAPVGLCVFSPDLRYLRINEKLAEINGIAAADHLGRTVEEIVPSLGVQARTILEQIVTARQPVRFDFAGERPAKPSEQRIWHEEWHPHWAADGSLAYISVVTEEVTESRQARRALEHSQALLGAFLEQLPMGAGLVDTQGRWVIRNQMLSQWVGDRLPSRDPDNQWRWMACRRDGGELEPSEYPGARALRGEHVPGVDFLYTGYDGNQRWTRLSASPFRDSTGEITGAVCVFEDVDTQKRTQEALRDFSDTLRFHIENTPLALVELAPPDYRITRWSQRAQQIFGWTAEELLGHPVADTGIIFADDAESVARLNAAMLAGRELTNVHQNRNCAKDGSVRMMRWYNSARLDANGKLASVFSLGLDVTDQVASEKALIASETRFRRLIEQSIFGVAIGDLNGNLIYFNDAFLKMVGYRRDDLKGGGLRWDVMTPAEWAPADERARVELRRTGQATPFEKEYFRKDGTRVPIFVGLTALDSSIAEEQEVVGFFMDLTEIKRVQGELERSNDELKRFVYTAGHDLQEPVRTVTSFAQLLERRVGGRMDVETEGYLAFILQAVEQMSRLISSLLEFSRVGFQRAPEPQSVNLGKVLMAVEQVMGSTIETSAAGITHDPLPDVMADESQIMQVLQNLIGNAIKYRKETESPRIHVSSKRCNAREWQISVRDNGIGFDPRYAGQIFGVFQRLHGPNISGSGLGLAICRRIVENHGGRIWAESVPGEGSTFHFTLRAVASDS
ncbi:MAG: PAS domain S-box protein [Bryobacterales bacterium]|nr:PAS domain S-box protein [Bryobacterales bacterium]